MTAAFMRTICTGTSRATHCRYVAPPSRPSTSRSVPYRTKKNEKKKKNTEQAETSSHGRMEKHELFENMFYCTVANLGRIVRRGSTLVRVPFFPFFFLIAVPWCDWCVSRLHQRLLLPMRGQCQDINFPCDGLSPPPPPSSSSSCSLLHSLLCSVHCCQPFEQKVQHCTSGCFFFCFFLKKQNIFYPCVCVSLSVSTWNSTEHHHLLSGHTESTCCMSYNEKMR